MKSITYLFLTFLLSVNFLFAQQLIEPSSGNSGIDGQKINQLDQFIEGYINQGAVPGGVFLVARKGEIVYHKSFGKRSTAGSPYQKDDIFRIASMTKAITAVSIMQLYEQGKLGLDDPVHYYLPAFKNMTVFEQFNESDSSFVTRPAKKAITIRHLLTHTSGIIYGDFVSGHLNLMYKKYNMTNVGLSHPEWTTDELLDNLAKVPLAFEPGEKYAYGLNMDVLGGVIQAVSGLKLDKYFEQNIFTPLKMNDTFFYLPKEKHKRLVPIYTMDENGGIIDIGKNTAELGLDYPIKEGRDHFTGGAGLSSTALDYAIFIQALLNNGTYNGVRILSRNAIETMTSDQMILLNKAGKGFSKTPGVTFGLGFSLLAEDAAGLGPKSPGTYEWGGYFNTKFFIDPAEELIFVGMTQMVPFYRNDFWDRIYAIIYGSIDD